MNDDQNVKCHTQSNQDEPRLTRGMLRIGQEDGVLI